eukprot:UN19028
MSKIIFKDRVFKRVFFSRTPLRTPPGVRNGVRIGSTYGVRNGVRNNCRNPKPMVDGQKLSKLSYGI